MKCCIITFILLSSISACAEIKTTAFDGKSTPAGIPWIETRFYDVYVQSQDGKKIEYLGRQAILDKANNWESTSPTRWQTNYYASSFTNVTMKMEMHPNTGTPKIISLDQKSNISAASDSAKTIVNLPDDYRKAKDAPADK